MAEKRMTVMRIENGLIKYRVTVWAVGISVAFIAGSLSVAIAASGKGELSVALLSFDSILSVVAFMFTIIATIAGKKRARESAVDAAVLGLTIMLLTLPIPSILITVRIGAFAGLVTYSWFRGGIEPMLRERKPHS